MRWLSLAATGLASFGFNDFAQAQSGAILDSGQWEFREQRIATDTSGLPKEMRSFYGVGDALRGPQITTICLSKDRLADPKRSFQVVIGMAPFTTFAVRDGRISATRVTPGFLEEDFEGEYMPKQFTLTKVSRMEVDRLVVIGFTTRIDGRWLGECTPHIGGSDIPKVQIDDDSPGP